MCSEEPEIPPSQTLTRQSWREETATVARLCRWQRPRSKRRWWTRGRLCCTRSRRGPSSHALETPVWLLSVTSGEPSLSHVSCDACLMLSCSAGHLGTLDTTSLSLQLHESVSTLTIAIPPKYIFFEARDHLKLFSVYMLVLWQQRWPTV